MWLSETTSFNPVCKNLPIIQFLVSQQLVGFVKWQNNMLDILHSIKWRHFKLIPNPFSLICHCRHNHGSQRKGTSVA